MEIIKEIGDMVDDYSEIDNMIDLEEDSEMRVILDSILRMTDENFRIYVFFKLRNIEKILEHADDELIEKIKKLKELL